MPRLKYRQAGVIANIILCCVLLAGCATLNKDECLNADWRTIGYEDGARGLPASHIGKHRKACARHGVTPNFDAYEKGRVQGLREYCTPKKGYSMGAAGKPFPSVCPEELVPAVMDGYQRGRRVYKARKIFNREQAALEKLYKDMEAVTQKINDYEAELVKDGTGMKRRRFLLEEIKILAEEQDYLAGETAAQERVVEDTRSQYYHMKRQNSY